MTDPKPIRYNTTHEEATRLKVSERTLLRWRDDGRIPGAKIQRAVRFDPIAVDQALAELAKTNR